MRAAVRTADTGMGGGFINLLRFSWYVTCVHQPSQEFAQRTDATVQNACNVRVAPRHICSLFRTAACLLLNRHTRTHTVYNLCCPATHRSSCFALVFVTEVYAVPRCVVTLCAVQLHIVCPCITIPLPQCKPTNAHTSLE
jgi:hypothetical protein